MLRLLPVPPVIGLLVRASLALLAIGCAADGGLDDDSERRELRSARLDAGKADATGVADTTGRSGTPGGLAEGTRAGAADAADRVGNDSLGGQSGVANGGISGRPAGAGGAANLGGRQGTAGISAQGNGGRTGALRVGGTVAPGAPASAAGALGQGGASAAGGSPGAGGSQPASPEPFSFFVTSLKAIQSLSKSQKGFGGDLRFGQADGLAGADEICRQVAETSMPGSGSKQWRAFLSVSKGPDGVPIHAMDRVGAGPWYDRLGRLVAKTRADLAQSRPRGADAAILNDLPNEFGVPNHNPDNTGQVDNHDTLTGSDAQGRLYCSDWSCTCHDWTSSVGKDGHPRVGHTWPRGTGEMANWISALDEAGCGAGINLVETGPPDPSNPTVGSGGGYGGIYCLALTP